MSAGGNALIFSTYIGGSGHDIANGVALDASDNAVVVGETASSNFPTVNAYDNTLGGGVDGFVTRLSPSGTLLSSTYLGGGGDDRIRAVAVAATGVIHLAGSTASIDFPTIAPLQSSRSGGMDAFYTRTNSGASGLTMSTYWGGSQGSQLAEEAANGIALDAQGRIWIGGVTPSTDFPAASSGHQKSSLGGQSDGFVTVFGASGAVVWSSYVGGSGIDFVTAMTAGSSFVAAVGYTTSNDLRVTGAQQYGRAGGYDAFWTAFPLNATAPIATSYLGGSGSDSALAASANGSILTIAGTTMSSNFPVKSPVQASNPGGYGGFATKLTFGPGGMQITPTSGSGDTGSFTFSASHAQGWANISKMSLFFSATSSPAGGCHLMYEPKSGSWKAG